MKNLHIITLFAAALTTATASAQYDSNRVRFLSQINLTQMPGSPTSGAGASGYVSPNGREYAIMGVRSGTVIVDITNPSQPELLTLIAGSSTLWHESATLNGFGYFVSDSTGPGVQIVDLRNLDTNRTASVSATYTAGNVSTVHTVQANPVSKTIFLNGGSNYGVVFLDATDPVNLVEKGRWTAQYVHDCYITNYTSGPYAGKEVLFACCGGQGLYILDVTNKAAPVVLGSIKYLASGGYCHSGVLTNDKHYFLINDEFDEGNGLEPGATTHVIDVSNLSSPFEATTFVNPIQVIDHNSQIQDGYMFLAAYRGGIRVYNPTDPLAIKEVGYFDSYPGPDGFNYDGDWGLSCVFPSGNIILSDIDSGLFVVDPSEAKGLGAPIISVLTTDALTDGVKVLRKPDGNAATFHANTSYVVNLQTTAKTRQAVDVTVRANVTSGRASLIVSAKNINTGAFDQIGVPALNSTMTDYSMNGLQAANYIDASGNIAIRVNVLAVGAASTGQVDMVRAVVK